MKLFSIRSVCNRCGFVNDTAPALTGDSIEAYYKCKICQFIIFSALFNDNKKEEFRE